MNTQSTSTFKKSVLSLFVISAVAGAFIPWEDYLPRSATADMEATYQNRDLQLESIVNQSITNVDSESLARIAEHNLTAELDAEIDVQVALNAQKFIEQSASPEADEPYDQHVESEQLTFAKIEDKSAEQVSDERPLYIITSPVLFSFNSSEINARYYEALNDSAHFMKNEGKIENSIWQIVGYADLSGNARYNHKLALQRAQKVATYLVNKGVEEDQLSVLSLGAASPINDQLSIKNNRNERRVEIHRYQAEITTLVEQYNKQLKQHQVVKKVIEPLKKLVVKRAVEVQQLLLVKKVAESKALEKNKKIVPVNNVQIELSQTLNTAMEL